MVIRYFEPTPINCLFEPWFREVGFGLFYGSMIIKLYRVLAEFQTRKAHRVCVRDKDLLKYLASVILVIVGYLAAWTALILDVIDGINNISGKVANSRILMEISTADDLKFRVCKELSWDYVTELGEWCGLACAWLRYVNVPTLESDLTCLVSTGETLFLLTGVYITYCIRNARREIYKEKWTLCSIIYVELVISTVTYVLRHIFYQSIHPDIIFMLYFARCQLTVTLSLILLLTPKVSYGSIPDHHSFHEQRCATTFSLPDPSSPISDKIRPKYPFSKKLRHHNFAQ